MAKPRIDLIGQRFGKLTVIKYEGTRASGITRVKHQWMCTCDCGGAITVIGNSLQQGMTRSCGCLRSAHAKEHIERIRVRKSGAEHPNWKGGRHVDQNGYVVLAQSVAQNACPDIQWNRSVLEHHLVMCQLLGRSLTPEETVHHKNGNRSDNTPTNLELWSSSQPAGQRVSDKVMWAKQILQQYEPDALR